MTLLTRTVAAIFFSALFPVLAMSATDGSNVPADLNAGYRQMYNLDLAAAHQTFSQWEQAHPNDPVGATSNAAAYLFAEFNRLKILEFDLFTRDEKFEKRPKLAPDPEVKTSFESELAKSDQIANRELASKPNDARALLALVMASGLRGDYAALVEKRNLAGLSYMKNSR